MKIGDKVKIRPGVKKTICGTAVNKCSITGYMANLNIDYCIITNIIDEEVTLGTKEGQLASSFYRKDLILLESTIIYNYNIL